MKDIGLFLFFMVYVTRGANRTTFLIWLLHKAKRLHKVQNTGVFIMEILKASLPRSAVRQMGMWGLLSKQFNVTK